MPHDTSDLTSLVIDENAIRALITEEGLREAGHMRVTVIHEVNGVARTIKTLQPDVIVIDLEDPNSDMMEHLFQLTRTVSRAIAMFVDRSDTASIEPAVEAGISAYIVYGLKRERIKRVEMEYGSRSLTTGKAATTHEKMVAL